MQYVQIGTLCRPRVEGTSGWVPVELWEKIQAYQAPIEQLGNADAVACRLLKENGNLVSDALYTPGNLETAVHKKMQTFGGGNYSTIQEVNLQLSHPDAEGEPIYTRTIAFMNTGLPNYPELQFYEVMEF